MKDRLRAVRPSKVSTPMPLEKILVGRYEENAFTRLVKDAGIDRETLETMLRWAAVLLGKEVSFTPRTDIRRIDGLIKRIRNVTEDLKRVNESPFVVPAAVAQSRRTAKRRAAFAGALLNRPRTVRELLPSRLGELPEQLREYADMLVGLRAYHRLTYPRHVTHKRHLLLILLLLVGSSGKIKTRWNNLATLLNAAFQAAGTTSNFTGNSLRTSYSRIVIVVFPFG